MRHDGHPELGDVGVGQFDVTVRRRVSAAAFGEARVQPIEQARHVRAVLHIPAVETDGVVQPAMELDQALGPGGGVQPVDVLRDDARHDTQAFQPRERLVRRIRPSRAHPPPPCMRPGPVPLPCRRRADELRVGHRGPDGLARTAVVRDPGIGGDARTGEHERAGRPDDLERLIDPGRSTGHRRPPVIAPGYPVVKVGAGEDLSAGSRAGPGSAVDRGRYSGGTGRRSPATRGRRPGAHPAHRPHPLRERRQPVPAAAAGGGAGRRRRRGRRPSELQRDAPHPAHVPVRRHQPVRAVADRRDPGGGPAVLRPVRGRGRRSDRSRRAGCDRREGERRAVALRPEARSRSGERQCRDGRRHRRQQLVGDVLWHGGQRLPHDALDGVRPPVRHSYRLRGRRCRGRVRRRRTHAGRHPARVASGVARRPGARGDRAPQARREEHHRLRAQRTARPRDAALDLHASAGRLRGNARLHRRGRPGHRPGPAAPRNRPGDVRDDGRRLRCDRRLPRRRGGGRRTARPCVPAGRGGPARGAGRAGGPRPGHDGAAGRDA